MIKAGVKFFRRQDLESKMELNTVYPQATPGNQVKDKEDEYLMKGSGPLASQLTGQLVNYYNLIRKMKIMVNWYCMCKTSGESGCYPSFALLSGLGSLDLRFFPG